MRITNNPQVIKIPLTMANEWDILSKHRGVYLSPHKLEAEVNDCVMFHFQGEVRQVATITEIEGPNQCKRGDLAAIAMDYPKIIKDGYKYHWSEGAVKIPINQLLRRSKSHFSIIVDKEDEERILKLKWCHNKSGPGYLCTDVKGKQVTLQRFILQQSVRVYHDNLLDYRKTNLSIKNPKPPVNLRLSSGQFGSFK